MTRAPALLAERVCKAYGSGPTTYPALRGVSFELRSGELAVLRGPSGSGKSTLLNVLCGWEAPDSGALRWSLDDGGRADQAFDRLAWAQLAIVPQSMGLLDELSLRENVALPGRLAFGAARQDLVGLELLLDQVGLATAAGRLPAEASLGEQQRAAVARALLLTPAVVLADEPTAHQDAHWVHHIFRLLRAAADGGTACLVATHSIEGLTYADRVLEIRDGRLDDGETPSG